VQLAQPELRLTEEEARAVRDKVLELLGIYKYNLDQYRQVFTKWVDEQGYPPREKAKTDLKKLQEYYQLKDEDITLLEQEAENLRQQEAQRRQQQIKQELDSRPQQPALSDDNCSDRGGDLLFKEAEQLEDVKLRAQPAPSNDLSSDRGIDYTRLRDLLKASPAKSTGLAFGDFSRRLPEMSKV
jgi:hypothetical protein